MALRSGASLRDDLDELAHGRGSHHAHHVGVGAEQRLERLDDGAMPGHVAHVDVVVDLGRHVGGGKQPASLAHFQRHRARADALEQLARDPLGHHAVGRGLKHQSRGIGGGEPVVEPVQPKIGDRGNIDQHLGHHHEQDGEHEELAGQAQSGRPRAFGCDR